MRTRLEAAGAALALLLGLVVVGPAQISPGPLARPHTQLEGSLNCTKCHGTNKSAMNSACLSCHKEIDALIQRGRGLHARDAKGSCAKCHPDHAGLDFDLIKWNEAGQIAEFKVMLRPLKAITVVHERMAAMLQSSH